MVAGLSRSLRRGRGRGGSPWGGAQRQFVIYPPRPSGWADSWHCRSRLPREPRPLLLEASSDLERRRLRTFWKSRCRSPSPASAAVSSCSSRRSSAYVPQLLERAPAGSCSGSAIQRVHADLDWQFGSAMAMFLIFAVAVLLVVFGRPRRTERGGMNVAVSNAGRPLAVADLLILVVFCLCAAGHPLITSFIRLISSPSHGKVLHGAVVPNLRRQRRDDRRPSLSIGTRALTAVVTTVLASRVDQPLCGVGFAKGLVSGVVLAPLDPARRALAPPC